ncbi:hypothetical protein ABZT06_20555 [Streptomyces sp. NPDC005483]|uniref:hypothetical protein n=1 Tax=Streptomyces sp. NPDC005483 TaxID=3154882 RepID=UPI0033B343F6
MSFPPHDFDPAAPPGAAARARDRGVTRVRGLTRWIAVAALAGTAALGAVYTHLLPGSPTPPTPAAPVVHNPVAPSSTATHGATGDDSGSHEGDDDEGEGAARTTQPALRAPAQPPTPTPQQPQSTTGAS